MTDHANTADDIPPLIPGETRIRDADGFVGTVVYVGPVASAKNPQEQYAGIVWDDPSRGKHDGSVLCRLTNQVVRHFGNCGPTQGSFLRIPKVDCGVALNPALWQSKYVELAAPVIAPNNILPHLARTCSGRDDKPIEFLGELQIRQRQQLDELHKISLRREGIARADATNVSDDERFQNITDVDLAGNLLSHWKDVLQIMQQFPNLTDFSVAYNRIRDVPTDSLPVVNYLDRIQVLNLNHCGIRSFQTVVWVAHSMPSLQSLCIAASDLSDICNTALEALEGHFTQLKVLDCSDCQLTSWEDQVSAYFGKFPCLEQLGLDDNPIASIKGTNNGAFAALQSLQLAGTAISTWNDLEGINTLQIRSVRLKNTPLTSTMGQGEVRFLCIARVPTLEYLNGSIISTKERTEAERRYVTMVAQLLVQLEQRQIPAEGKASDDMETQKQTLLLDHPQYTTLLDKHKGLILPTSITNGNNAGSSVLASSVCNVTITSLSASSCTMEPLIRRLPGSLTVGRLKALCARAFGLDLDLMSLHFRTESDAFPVELDNDDNALSYYGVCDGAEILMNEIDLEARRRESERMAKAQDERILQQESDAMAMQQIKQQKNSQG